ncbi:MAG: FapA family protein, partial [Thermotogota bacterium]|nr:FapA family protein [Thermotogota bacterium]HPX96640.1 FapA family protein [Thermotogota bacterium]
MERRVEIIVDAQKMNAFLVFHPQEGDNRGPQKSEVEEAIHAQNIRFGIKEEKITAFLSAYIPDVPYLFARGVPSESCQDADIVFNFDL